MSWWKPPQMYLDVRQGEVRIVEGRARGTNLMVNKWAVLELDNPLTRMGGADVAREQGVRLGEFLQQQRFLKREAAVVVGQEGIIIRTVQVPEVAPRLLKNFLNEQIGEFLPIDLSEYVYDYRITRRLPGDGRGGSTLELLLAAVPRYLTEQVISFSEAAGLELKVIDVLPNVQLNLFNLSPYKDVLVVEGDGEGARFTLFDDRSVLLYAEVPFRFIAAGDDRSFILESLLEEARGYLNFFASRHQGRMIEAICVTGHFATPSFGDESVWRRWESELGVSLLSRAEEFAGLSYRGQGGEEFKNLAPLYAGNIGLMLKKY